jgi:hypothetical protein
LWQWGITFAQSASGYQHSTAIELLGEQQGVALSGGVDWTDLRVGDAEYVHVDRRLSPIRDAQVVVCDGSESFIIDYFFYSEYSGY